ncbi:2-deoxy-D-gluconate 3-dehydrogenase [Striga asiatica]|uniref:2-deoxy-D-gluconate 3-dehydrogenase n=1 Tax=Striga asiatica TaxID=4170 RepID=A0A5A7QSV6_STRAF|nr:2-deoxy-D-gluconate 3-dehydrogenase [Striga asiatica]
MATYGISSPATTLCMSGSNLPPETSFTILAPCLAASEATSDFPSISGKSTTTSRTEIKRLSSCSGESFSAIGRVDCAPISIISAPSAKINRARSTADFTSANLPLSLKLSGFKLRTPMTHVFPHQSRNSPATGKTLLIIPPGPDFFFSHASKIPPEKPDESCQNRATSLFSVSWPNTSVNGPRTKGLSQILSCGILRVLVTVEEDVEVDWAWAVPDAGCPAHVLFDLFEGVFEVSNPVADIASEGDYDFFLFGVDFDHAFMN